MARNLGPREGRTPEAYGYESAPRSGGRTPMTAEDLQRALARPGLSPDAKAKLEEWGQKNLSQQQMASVFATAPAQDPGLRGAKNVPGQQRVEEEAANAQELDPEYAVMARVEQPPPQQMQQPQMQMAGMGGIGGGGIRRAGAAAIAGMEGAQGRLGKAVTAQAQQQTDLAKYSAQTMQQTADQIKQDVTWSTREAADQEAIESIKKNRMDALEQLKYAAPTEETQKRLDTVEEDSNATPEERESAQRWLNDHEGLDANRVYKTTGHKILGAIGMALGAYGAALAKTPNYAMQIIQAALDRELRGQESLLNRKATYAQGLKTEYQMARQQYKDTVTARRAAEVALWDDVGQKIKIHAAKLGGPAAANAEVFLSQVGMKQNEITGKMHMTVSGQIQQANVARMKMMDRQQGQQQTQPEFPNFQVTNPALVERTQAYKKMPRISELADTMLLNIRELRELRGAEGVMTETLSPDEYAQAKALYTSLFTAYRDMGNMGARLEPSEVKLIEKVAIDVTGVGWKQAQLSAAEKIIRRTIKAAAAAHGFSYSPQQQADVGFEATP